MRFNLLLTLPRSEFDFKAYPIPSKVVQVMTRWDGGSAKPLPELQPGFTGTATLCWESFGLRGRTAQMRMKSRSAPGGGSGFITPAVSNPWQWWNKPR